MGMLSIVEVKERGSRDIGLMCSGRLDLGGWSLTVNGRDVRMGMDAGVSGAFGDISVSSRLWVL